MTYAEQPIGEFLSNVASSQVAPSAGATAALTGALAASLSEMVALHTSETETSARLRDAKAELRNRREELLTLADQDAAVVEQIQTAFETDTADSHGQAVRRTATELPVRIAEAARDIAASAVVVAADGTPNARTDAVVGTMIAQAAVQSAATIVRANLGLIDDEGFRDEARSRVESAESDAAAAVESVTGHDE